VYHDVIGDKETTKLIKKEPSALTSRTTSKDSKLLLLNTRPKSPFSKNGKFEVKSFAKNL